MKKEFLHAAKVASLAVAGTAAAAWATFCVTFIDLPTGRDNDGGLVGTYLRAACERDPSAREKYKDNFYCIQGHNDFLESKVEELRASTAQKQSQYDAGFGR